MLKHVQPGEPMRQPSADGHNAMVDAAEFHRRRQRLGTGGQQFNAVRGQLVKVQNDSSGTVPVGGVLGISGLAIQPSDDDVEKFRRPIFTGVAPQIETHGGKFCIAQEPIKQDAVGRCVLSGETFAKVNLVDVDDVLCGVTDDSTTKLTSGLGLCRILAIPSGASTGDNWCWVRIGDFCGGVAAQANGAITARSGDTPGTGNVDLKYIASGGDYATFSTVAVKNWVATPYEDEDWCWVVVDAFGRAHAVERDCG